MTSPENEALSKDAERAWQAYQAMSESKQGYFGFLKALDEKYAPGQSPSIAENLKLEQLLAAHDENVKAFNAAMARVEDDRDREQLMAVLSRASASASSH